MTTEQFFQDVSQAVQASIYEIAFLIAFFSAIGAYALNHFVLAPRRYMRAKTEALIGYLRQRHNLDDEEWESLERAAKRSGVAPPYLAAVSEPSFDACREALRHEMNDDRRVEEISFRLFNQ